MKNLYTCQEVRDLERKRIAGTKERLVCHDLVRRWARAHDLEKIGKAWVFTEDDYKAFLARETVPGRKVGWNRK